MVDLFYFLTRYTISSTAVSQPNVATTKRINGIILLALNGKRGMKKWKVSMGKSYFCLDKNCQVSRSCFLTRRLSDVTSVRACADVKVVPGLQTI